MDVKEAISKRKSVRKYKTQEIPDNMISEIVDAGRLAPSGNNVQPWHFRILKGAEDIELLRKHNIAFQEFVYTAPLIIVCCGDPEAYKIKKGMDEGNSVRALRDLSIASAFMVLRAEELGIGSCYIGWIEKEKIKDVLELPKQWIVPFVLTFGYSNDLSKPTEKKPLDEVLV